MVELREVQKLYLAYLRRAGDPSGLKHYSEVLKTTNDITSLAYTFFHSEEFKSANKDLNLPELITEIYRFCFGREPDPQGFDFWLQAVKQNKIPIELLPYAIVDGARSGPDFFALENKITSAINFVMVLDPELDGSDPLATYSGSEDVVNVRRFLGSVTFDPKTIPDLTDSEIFVASRIADPEDKILKKVSLKMENLLKVAASKSFRFDSFTTLPSRLDPKVSPLLSGVFWGKREITYGFRLSEDPIYRPTGELSDLQKRVVRDAFAKISEFLDLKFIEVSYGGDIQIVSASLPKGIGGVTTYYSSNALFVSPVVIYLSDLIKSMEDRYFFRNDWGITGFGVILIYHEICHALGLKHPHEGYPVLETGLNKIPWTIMGYSDGKLFTPYIRPKGADYEMGITLNATPESIGILDLSSLMAIYGPNLDAKRQDTIYRIREGELTYKLIWDSGGEDLIDASSVSKPCIVNLEGGSLSSIGIYSIDLQVEELISKLDLKEAEREKLKEKVKQYLKEVESRGMLYDGEGNLAIANGCVIENVKTGDGDDIVYDNRVNNIIILGGGNDLAILGKGGFDTVVGGEGYDVLVLPYLKRDYEIVSCPEFCVLVHRDFAVRAVGFEEVRFEDDFILI